jgi:hypothetical protein
VVSVKKYMFQLRLLLVLASVAIVAVFGSLAVGSGGAAPASAATAGSPRVSAAELKLRQDMRKLWEDHVTWTRVVIISFAGGLADLTTAEARLLRNQADIGDAIKPFYGRAAGAQLTALLRSHILIAVDVLKAAKANNKQALTAAQANWQANADEIAALLNKANPRFWRVGEMRSMLRTHLRLTTGEAVARLTGKWVADSRTYDKIVLQALGMADMLSSGIVRQFPKRF